MFSLRCGTTTADVRASILIIVLLNDSLLQMKEVEQRDPGEMKVD